MKAKGDAGVLYPGLTAAAVLARAAALDRFARWEAEHPARVAAAVAIGAVTALYELLPPGSRRRAPDPSGVMVFHALLRSTRPTFR
jgi:hypothetical protein